MTATSAPFGFRPAYHATGLDRATRRAIASGYATALYKGMPVALATNGTIIAGAPASDIKGILAGVEFIDANGKPNYQPNWPAGQVTQGGQLAAAWVWEDPETIFEVQANGPVPQSAVGDQADVVNVGAGSDSVGQSTCGLNAALVGAGSQGQFRIMNFNLAPDNAPGDQFTVVQVKLARDQFVANKTAI